MLLKNDKAEHNALPLEETHMNLGGFADKGNSFPMAFALVFIKLNFWMKLEQALGELFDIARFVIACFGPSHVVGK